MDADVVECIRQCEAAGHDERLADGGLYLRAAALLTALRHKPEKHATFSCGDMRVTVVGKNLEGAFVTDSKGNTWTHEPLTHGPSDEMVLVPMEPTAEMIARGYAAAAFPRDPEICVAMYKAMIAAAEE